MAAGLRGVVRMWRKRRVIQKMRTVSIAQLEANLTPVSGEHLVGQ
jgi:hypothetical protein